MSVCDGCKHFSQWRSEEPCDSCNLSDWAADNRQWLFYNYEPIKTTRYEKIMADMDVEEMAELRIRWSEVDRYWHNDIPDAIYSMSEDALQAEIEWLQGVDE